MLALLLVSTAFAAQCWEVTGWTSSPAPGQPVVANAERAVLASIPCTVTPEQTRWLQVSQLAPGGSGLPTDLFVRVPAWDPSRSDGEKLFGGLQLQTMLYGVVPLLWRPLSGGTDDGLDWLAPSPLPPMDQARVLLRHRDTHALLWTTPIGYSLHSRDDDLTIDEDLSWAQWLGSPWTLESLGGDDFRVESEAFGYCIGLYNTWTPANTYCGIPASQDVLSFEPHPTAGGYVLRTQNNWCLMPGYAPDQSTVVLAECYQEEVVYDLITLEAGVAPPSDPDPVEIVPVTRGM